MERQDVDSQGNRLYSLRADGALFSRTNALALDPVFQVITQADFDKIRAAEALPKGLARVKVLNRALADARHQVPQGGGNQAVQQLLVKALAAVRGSGTPVDGAEDIDSLLAVESLLTEALTAASGDSPSDAEADIAPQRLIAEAEQDRVVAKQNGAGAIPDLEGEDPGLEVRKPVQANAPEPVDLPEATALPGSTPLPAAGPVGVDLDGMSTRELRAYATSVYHFSFPNRATKTDIRTGIDRLAAEAGE